MDEQIKRGSLSSPGEFAVYFKDIMDKPGWGIITISIRELLLFSPYFQKDWDKEIAKGFYRILLACKNTMNVSSDMVLSLSKDTYVIITKTDALCAWEDEVRKQFTLFMNTRLPSTLIEGQNVIVIADKVFPVPSLVIGKVSSIDGNFSDPLHMYMAAMDDREKNEKSKLEIRLNSFLLHKTQLSEELLMITSNRRLHSLICSCTRITSGHLCEIRNSLTLLRHHILKLNMQKAHIKQMQYSIDSATFILDSISEIRFQGTGKPEKVDLHHLVLENINSLRFSINHPIKFDDIEQTVIVYSHPRHILLSMFALLSSIKLDIKESSAITIACGISEKNGFIEIKGDMVVPFDSIITEDKEIPGIDITLDQNKQIQLTTNEYWPYVHIFKKIIQRLHGSIEINADSIFIFFPLYDYQDKHQLETLKNRNNTLKNEIHTLRTAIKKETEDDAENDITIEAIELIRPLLHRFINELEKFNQKVATLVHESEAIEINFLLAGSNYCKLMAGNMLSFTRGYIKTTEKTSLKKAFSIVQSILQYRIPGIADYKCVIDDTIPPVHATESTLAQVLLNLIIYSLAELSRVTPLVPRIHIIAGEETKYVVISIIDTGSGIGEERIDEVMKSTHTIFNEMKDGIGLFVVKSLLDYFGGKMECSTIPDKGTTVKIYLRKWEDNT